MATIQPDQSLDLNKVAVDHSASQWAGQRHHRLWVALGYLGMIAILIVIGMPIYWLVINAFKNNVEIYQIPPTWFPVNPTTANFFEAWQSAPFGRYYINSIIVTIAGSGLEIIFAITSAYAFAFLRFPKREWIFVILLAALMIPSQVTILPNYLTIATLGWINTYQGIFAPGASVAYGTFLLRQYYRTLPRDVLDAAKVDGAGHLRTLWMVVIPLARPAIITMAVLSIIGKWNDFLWPLIVTNTKDMRVLPIGIYWLRVEEGAIDWGVVMSGGLFVVLPVVIIFLYAQRFIVEGIAAGAVKG